MVIVTIKTEGSARIFQNALFYRKRPHRIITFHTDNFCTIETISSGSHSIHQYCRYPGIACPLCSTILACCRNRTMVRKIYHIICRNHINGFDFSAPSYLGAATTSPPIYLYYTNRLTERLLKFCQGLVKFCFSGLILFC